MAKVENHLGIFGAIFVVLIIMGLIALAANYLGFLPTY